MDLFAIGTPVIDLFARVSERELAALRVAKGATNFFSAPELSKIERKLGRKIAYRYPGDNARNVCEGFSALGGFCGFARTHRQNNLLNDGARIVRIFFEEC